jgi:hypothetical protein
METDKTKQQNAQDGLQIFDLLNEIYISYNPYDNPDAYVKECKKRFAGIEKDKNIEAIQNDLFMRWTNGQLDSLKEKGAAPDKNNIIHLLQNGILVITDYVYLFNKIKFS